MKRDLLRTGNDSQLDECKGHRRYPSADGPQFEQKTGRPLNGAAESQVAKQWASGQASRVSDLPMKTLSVATGGWSKHNELGGGGSCVVYRGQLYGELVAVKRLHKDATAWDTRQFRAEMDLLQRVTHRNICRLLAFSTDGDHRCLVLELCPKGSLEGRLAAAREAAGSKSGAPNTNRSSTSGGGGACSTGRSGGHTGGNTGGTTRDSASSGGRRSSVSGSSRGTRGHGRRTKPLPWDERVRIAVGVARALACLHEQSPPMLHR